MMSSSCVGASSQLGWGAGAEALVNNLYPRALRSVIQATGKHASGLSVAAKEAREQRKIGSRMLKRLRRVDEAYHVNRHISLLSVEIFLKDLEAELLAEVAIPQHYEIGNDLSSDMEVEEADPVEQGGHDTTQLVPALWYPKIVALAQPPEAIDLDSMDGAAPDVTVVGVTPTPHNGKAEVIVANVATSNHYEALEETTAGNEIEEEEELEMIEKEVEEMLVDAPALHDYKERFATTKAAEGSEEIMDKMLGMVARLPMADLAEIPKLPFEIPNDGICKKTALQEEPQTKQAEMMEQDEGKVVPAKEQFEVKELEPHKGFLFGVADRELPMTNYVEVKIAVAQRTKLGEKLQALVDNKSEWKSFTLIATKWKLVEDSKKLKNAYWSIHEGWLEGVFSPEGMFVDWVLWSNQVKPVMWTSCMQVQIPNELEE